MHGVFSSAVPSSSFPPVDNPESDIAGANAAGWKSILVRSGVYDSRHGPPTHQPTHQTEDVAEAVRWALEQEVGS